MQNLQELKEELELFLESVESYESKPTKAESKRIRDRLLTLKKNAPTMRAYMIELDQNMKKD